MRCKTLILPGVALLTGFALQAKATTINLGTAGNYAVLAGGAISNSDLAGTTIAGGNAGAVGAEGFLTSANIVSPAKIDNTDAAAAVTALNSAYTAAKGLTPTATLSTLAELTAPLTPGVYDVTYASAFSGTVTLNDQGAVDPLFVFQTPGAVTLATNFSITTENAGSGSNPGSNVFWAVNGSATFDGGNSLEGHFLASGAISTGNSINLANGSLLADGSITLGSANGSVKITDAQVGSPISAPLPSTVYTGSVLLGAIVIANLRRKAIVA